MATINQLFPNGKLEGNYIVCGDIYGNAGRSFKYNITNELWSDFSKGHSGRGVSSLLRLRGEEPDLKDEIKARPIHTSKPVRREIKKDFLIPSDRSCEKPELEFRIPLRAGGKYQKYWEYKNDKGQSCFYVVRYNYTNGKETIPYSWNGTNWIPSAWEFSRPLYNSDKIKDYKKIMICEGEKCADAVKESFPDYLGVCWQGGSKAVNKSDWALIKDKEVVIFPDNDKAGYEAGVEIARILKHENKVRVLAMYKFDLEEGFDLADMVEQGFDFNALKKRLNL